LIWRKTTSEQTYATTLLATHSSLFVSLKITSVFNALKIAVIFSLIPVEIFAKAVAVAVVSATMGDGHAVEVSIRILPVNVAEAAVSVAVGTFTVGVALPAMIGPQNPPVVKFPPHNA